MNARPPDGSDEPEIVDPVMLAVLSSRGRDATVLSPDQERLLDDWVEGRLPPDAAEGAASLVKQNSFAAERVLERRLLAASERSPSVPQDLTARVLKSSAPPRAAASGGWWRLPRRWQWTGLAGAVVLASIVAIVGVPLWQQTMQGGAPIQIAMVTINDRSPLFESSDIRMRGTGPQQGAATDQRFRDVEMPTGVLRNLIATAGQPAGAASREIEAHLPAAAGSGNGPVRVILDSALKERVEASDGRDRMPVRIYDLNDPRAADIRSMLRPPPDGERAYLLTLKP
jgi:hypothetical protein